MLQTVTWHDSVSQTGHMSQCHTNHMSQKNVKDSEMIILYYMSIACNIHGIKT